MADLQTILATTIFKNTVQDYVVFIAIFSLALGMMRIFRKYILQLLKKFAKKTKTHIDDIVLEIIDAIHWPFYIYFALLIATKFLVLPEIVNKTFNFLLLFVIVYYAVLAIQNIIDYVAKNQINKRKENGKLEDTSIIRVFKNILKFVVWIVAGLFLLSNFGVEITPLIASLGIGGLAIAFALQKILEDLFNSFVIYLDKPFQVGDFIVVGGDSGTVKYIGLKTTRIQALQGQELVVSNTELVGSRINNYKQMKDRRIPFTIGLEYGTSTAKLKKVPSIIEKIINDVEGIRFDRCHFKEFADFSLNFEIVYYVESKDYADYMDKNQKINLGIKQAFEKEKIGMAFPTQTVYLKK